MTKYHFVCERLPLTGSLQLCSDAEDDTEWVGSQYRTMNMSSLVHTCLTRKNWYIWPHHLQFSSRWIVFCWCASKPWVETGAPATCRFSHDFWMEISQVWAYIREGTVRDRCDSFVSRVLMFVLRRDGTCILAWGVHLRAACQPVRVRFFGLM